MGHIALFVTQQASLTIYSLLDVAPRLRLTTRTAQCVLRTESVD